MTIHLPTDIAGQLAAHVSSGEYASTEDALRAAVKLLGEEKDRLRRLEDFKRSLREAEAQIERGECLDVDEAFDQVEIELYGHKLADE
jgi:Arc/MetJ-type ribon-helix-helix transcriptional regulator